MIFPLSNLEKSLKEAITMHGFALKYQHLIHIIILDYIPPS